MNLETLNKWLTLLANFGVIGGLVLVAVQMNVNAERISLQNDLEMNRQLAAGELAVMGDSAATAYTNAIFRPAEMTETQLGQFWAYLHHALLASQNNWIAYRNGRASTDSWNHAKAQAAAHLGSRAARIWWAYDKFEFHAAFVDEIESELSKSDPLIIEEAMRQMLDEIRSLEVSTVKDT